MTLSQQHAHQLLTGGMLSDEKVVNPLIGQPPQESTQSVLPGGLPMLEVDIMRTLKIATHDAHQLLHRVVDLKQMVRSPENYFGALERYLSIIAPLEKGLVSFHARGEHGFEYEDEGSINWEARLCKSQWIREDLEQKTYCLAATEDSGEVPLCPVRTLAEFLGRTYVTEGLTLGAVPILQLITGAPALESVEQHRFFSGYGTQTDEHWQTYHHWACAQSVDTDAVVSEALATFDIFSEALRVR